jgi:zinc transport system substrate-binding protein
MTQTPAVLSRLAVVLALLVGGPLMAAPAAAAANGAAPAPAPSVVATLLPLHSLAAGVMAGVGTPHLLVPPSASPHAYALAPSDAAALAGADLILWVDPALETFLTASLDRLANRTSVLRVSTVAGTIRLPRREGTLWADDDHEHEHDHEHDHEHVAEDGNFDPHPWLDPRNAIVWTRAIAAALSGLDPERAATYTANAEAQVASLERLDDELGARLAPLVGRPFLVSHDAFHYLEDRYGLSAVGAVSLALGRPAGVRHMVDLEHRLTDSGALCIFHEPDDGAPLAARLAEGTPIRLGVLDPLGRDQAPGAGHYAATLRAVADGLTACLDVPAEGSGETAKK